MAQEQITIFLILIGILALFAWGRLRYDVVAFLGLILSVILGLIPAQNAFDGDGFPGAGASDDHHAFAFGDMQIDAPQDVFGTKGLMDVIKRDHWLKNTDVRMKLAARIKTAAAWTEDLVASPTPCAPRPEFIPK